MKRLLAFLLLATLGIVALKWAIADEVTARPKATPTDAPNPAEQQAVPGIPVQQGRTTASVALSGTLDLVGKRDVPQPDGSIRTERTYVLHADDSQPVEEGLQQLDGLTVQFFDQGKHAATLTAPRAFTQLAKDANGRPALDQTKEIDLRDAVLVTEPGSRLAGMRLDLGNAKVVVADGEIVLTTPRDQLVTITLAGARQATLRGYGGQARLPRDSASASQRADVELLRDPVFESDGITVRAKGRLHYVEERDIGTAHLTLDDDVRMDVARGDLHLPGVAAPARRDPTTPARPIEVRGDQFHAWLLRDAGAERAAGDEQSTLVWRQLVLTGAPATVDLLDGLLSTPRLTVLPGLFGEPFLVTAHGGESRIEQTGQSADRRPGERFVATGKRRIHVVRPGDHVGALHRGMGFPSWSLGALHERQVVLFEGETRVQSGERTLQATSGARAFRRDRTTSGIVQGLGAVRVEQPAAGTRPALVGTGSDGCWLRRDGAREWLRLGPPAPGDDESVAAAWREHRYDVQYGDAQLRGRGNCDLDRDGTTTRVWLFAPNASIQAALPAEGLRLTDVRELRATMQDRELAGLDVAGWPVQIDFARGDETVHATAPHVRQSGPRSLELLPEPANAPAGLYRDLAEANRLPKLVQTTADRRQQAEVRGPSIALHHVGGRAALVDAIAVGDVLPTLHARLLRDGERDTTTLSCEAERLQLLPFAANPTVQRHLAGIVGAPLATVGMRTLGRTWLLLQRVRDFQLDDPSEGHLDGHAHELLLSQGAEAAQFRGDPAAGTQAVVHRRHQGRTVSLRGARVRVFRADALRLHALGTFDGRSTFLPPELTLHEPGRSGLLSHMRAACRGNIEVRPEAIVFLGPVVVDSLGEDGSPLADGMHIDARELQLARLSNGDVARVVARDVKLDWPRLSARSQKLDIDLLFHVAIADDPNGATVELPGGMVWQSTHIEADYESFAIRTHRGRGLRTVPPVEDAR